MAYTGGIGRGAPTGLILSPWPEEGGTAEEAALCYLQQAAGGFAESDEQAGRSLGQVAAAMVEREAPNAPQAIKNQAVVRYAGYLGNSDFGGIREESLSERSAQYVVNHQRAWINCGAKALLSPWKPLGAATVKNGGTDD